MSALTDTLIDGLNSLLASGSQIPASRLRAYEALVVGAIGTLEARARGNQIHYTSGVPGNSLGLEGDLGVNKLTGDFFQFVNGQFVLLFNGTGKVGAFTPIAQNAFGTHPAFTDQDTLNDWLLANGGAGGGTTPTPAKPTITGFLPMSGAQGSTVVLTGTNFTGATLVSINLATVASFTVDSATQITAVLSGSQVTGRVRVTTAAGTGVSSSDFTVTVAIPNQPTITSFTPTSGAPATTLVITGTNFTGATLVSLNSATVASFTVDSATQITAVLSSSQATGKVRVTTPAGTAVSTNSFTVTTPATAYIDVLFSGLPDQSNGSGLTPVSQLPAGYGVSDPRVLTYNALTDKLEVWQLGYNDNSINSHKWPDANGNMTYIVPAYGDQYGPSFGREVGFIHDWLADPANANKKLLVFKKWIGRLNGVADNTNSATAAYWESTLYPAMLQEWQACLVQLNAQSLLPNYILKTNGLGEGDSDAGTSAASFQAKLTSLNNRAIADGLGTSTTPMVVAKKQRPQDAAAIVPGQIGFVNATPGAVLLDIPNPVFFDPPQTHYNGPSEIALGKSDYQQYAAGITPPTGSPTITSFSPTRAVAGETITVTGTNFTSSFTARIGGELATSTTYVNATTVTVVVPATAVDGFVQVSNSIGTGMRGGFQIMALAPVLFAVPRFNTFTNFIAASDNNSLTGTVYYATQDGATARHFVRLPQDSYLHMLTPINVGLQSLKVDFYQNGVLVPALSFTFSQRGPAANADPAAPTAISPRLPAGDYEVIVQKVGFAGDYDVLDSYEYVSA